MKIDRNIDISGTSFHWVTVVATRGELEKTMGAPTDYSSGKVFFEWAGKTDGGDVFTVYDWKHSRRPARDAKIEWHIGGFSKAATEQAKREILELLKREAAR